jgi:hypothetical protein
MHGVGDPCAEQRPDAITVEQALDHDGLGSIAAIDLHEPVIVAGGREGRPRKSDHLRAPRRPARHRLPILRSLSMTCGRASPTILI